MKFLFHPFLLPNPKILKAFQKRLISTGMKPILNAQQRKKMREGEKAFFLLSVHARTSQVNISHLAQKAAKCSSCKRLCGRF